MLGGAITNIKSDFKFNDKKKGDSAQASSSAVSLYGSKSISEKVFVQGSASIVHSDIKVKSLKKITNDVQKYAQAKFASIGASVDMSLKYLKRFENGSSLTPMIGIKYAKNSDGGFDETGVGLYNINVASRKSQFITARAGAAFNFASINASRFKITPGLKAVVSQQLLAKSEKVQTTLNWNGQDYKQEVNLQTHQKTALNLGAGVSVSKRNVDLSANYDFTLKKKFQSHEGSLKVRVNF